MSVSRLAIVCPDCETRVLVEPHQIGEKLASHNNLQHGGDAVASVAGGHVDRLKGDRL